MKEETDTSPWSHPELFSFLVVYGGVGGKTLKKTNKQKTAIIRLSLCRLSVTGSGSSLLLEQLEPFFGA